MAISKEILKKIAKLARIQFSEEEEDRYFNQLSSILGYVDKLQTLPKDKIANLEDQNQHSIEDLRPDITDGGRYQENLINLAPESNNNQFVVPGVFGNE